MNQVAVFTDSAVLTMGTFEISKLLGSDHATLRRSASRLALENVINGGLPLAETSFTHPQNKQVYKEYRLNKRDSLILVAQNCPAFTAAVVDRWQVLEEQVANQTPAIPQTYAAALLEAGRLALENEKQAEQLALAAPKVEFVDKYVEAEGLKGFRETAKLLNVKENSFRAMLIDEGIMYPLAGKLTPYAYYLDAGYFVIRTGHNFKNGHAYNSAKFTPKGITWIAKKLADYRLLAA